MSDKLADPSHPLKQAVKALQDKLAYPSHRLHRPSSAPPSRQQAVKVLQDKLSDHSHTLHQAHQVTGQSSPQKCYNKLLEKHCVLICLC
ncbi:hypothetical protein AALO_G00092590 [Alosa alosa]|uniref:Uncharacterized protein n=1 Tax=Alosa alosa TaxID=278164 RepID=A0AAV6GWI8_9TELE|nr:hypothetical protein AALO_G00092590 [Alosa alosa]